MSHVLLIGLGDLGRRIALILSKHTTVGRLTIAARDALGASSFSVLCEACGRNRVQSVQLNALNQGECAKLIRQCRPDLIIQCAVSTSPWLIAGSRLAHVEGLAKVGFGWQVPFQLNILLAVKRAAAEAGYCGPLVNCSYPDVTNAVLGRAGCAPTVGIGNVSMIAAVISARLRASNNATSEELPLVCVVAEHLHTVGCLTGVPSGIPAQFRPLVYLGSEQVRRADEMAYVGVRMNWSKETNALSAETAASVVKALLPEGNVVRMSVPGPLGLLGGYPVVVSPGHVELDLPGDLTAETAETHNRAVARLEGIEDILANGTVIFSGQTSAALASIDQRLAEPLELAKVGERASLLAQKLELPYWR